MTRRANPGSALERRSGNPEGTATSNAPPVRAWHQPFPDRLRKETLYLLLDLPIGLAGFTLVVTGLSLSLSLLITLLGVPLLAATLLLARSAGRAELARARMLLDFELLAPRLLPPRETSLARVFGAIRDPAAWRATAYFALMLPIGTLTFAIAVAWWGATLVLLTLPAWAWALPHGGPAITDTYYWSQPWQLALSFIVGIFLALATPAVIHTVTFIDRALLTLVRRGR